MPAVALARSLLYLFGATTGEETSAFQCPPWTQPVWRDCFGQAALRPDNGDEDEMVDVDGESLVEEFARDGDGFVFSRKALSSLAPAKLKMMTDGHTVLLAEKFMKYFWRSWCDDSLKNRPIEYTISLLPPDLNSELLNKQGYSEYREVVLAMLNRPGGVLAAVEEVMVQLRVTPAEKWKDERDTNRRRKGRLVVPEYDVPIPTAGSAVEAREVQAAVARRLFGDQAVDRGGTILTEYVKTVLCLLQRRYESLYRRLKNRRLKSMKQKTEVDRRLEEARQEKTPKALREVSRALLEWRRTAKETLEHDDPPFLSREKELKDLWAQLGFEVEEEVMRRERRTGHTKASPSIPTDAEMVLAFQYYVEEYCHALGDSEEPPVPAAGLPSRVHDLTEGETDIGVAHLKDWTIERVWESMGLPGATQFPFAEPGTLFPPEFRRRPKPKATPEWHQVIGVHAILEGAFTRTMGERARPTMLCDDVGLGKTIQIIGVISMIAHLYEQQLLNQNDRLPPPPFTSVNGTPYFGGLDSLPNLPSLVISPRTLSNQWLDQWDRFTHRGSFVVVRYTVDQGSLEDFSTDPTGVYRQAAGLKLERASRVVILADISAIKTEAQRCLEPPPSNYRSKAAQLLEARGEPPEFKVGVNTKGSLLSMCFRVVAVDELHNLRNYGLAHQGILRIAENSSLVIGATATPLFTSPKNLVALARILRFAPLIGDEGQALCKEMLEFVGARDREWVANAERIIQTAALEEAQQAASKAGMSTCNSRFVQLLQEAELKYESEDQRNILRMDYVSQDVIALIRRVMRPIIVRRTATSRDSLGNLVLELPPVRTITVWSPMSQVEEDEVARVNEEHQKHRRSQMNLARTSRKKRKHQPAAIKWVNFLLSQKHAGLHHLILPLRQREKEEGLKEGELLDRMADDWNEGNLNEKASTRMLKVDELVEYYWQGNPKVPLYTEDGERNHGGVVGDPLPSNRPRKFLIYVAYRTHRNLIGKMFEIRKRGFVYYDGSMTTKQREKVVDKFNTDDDCRIMIISNVGAAGLNLTVASVVIFVSGVWSGQEKRQIIGRVWRYGQTRDVVVLDIVAPGGIDLALNGYADGKTCLSDKFLMSESKLRHVYQQVTAPEFDDGEDLEPESEAVSIKQTKVSTRKRKRQPGGSSGGKESEAALDKTTPAPLKPSKRAKTISDNKTRRREEQEEAMGYKAQPELSTPDPKVQKAPAAKQPTGDKVRPTLSASDPKSQKAPAVKEPARDMVRPALSAPDQKSQKAPAVKEPARDMVRPALSAPDQKSQKAPAVKEPARDMVRPALSAPDQKSRKASAVKEPARDMARPALSAPDQKSRKASAVKEPARDMARPALSATDQKNPPTAKTAPAIKPRPKMLRPPSHVPDEPKRDLFDLSQLSLGGRANSSSVQDESPIPSVSLEPRAPTRTQESQTTKKRAGFRQPYGRHKVAPLEGEASWSTSQSPGGQSAEVALLLAETGGIPPTKTLRLHATVSSKRNERTKETN